MHHHSHISLHCIYQAIKLIILWAKQVIYRDIAGGFVIKIVFFFCYFFFFCLSWEFFYWTENMSRGWDDRMNEEPYQWKIINWPESILKVSVTIVSVCSAEMWGICLPDCCNFLQIIPDRRIGLQYNIDLENAILSKMLVQWPYTTFKWKIITTFWGMFSSFKLIFQYVIKKIKIIYLRYYNGALL